MPRPGRWIRAGVTTTTSPAPSSTHARNSSWATRRTRASASGTCPRGGFVYWVLEWILPTFNTLIRHRGHYNAWKLLTCSFLVHIEMLRLMNKMSAKILYFSIGWHKPLKFWKCNQINKLWWYLLKHACFILKLKDFCNTCVHFQWKKTNACRHNQDTVSAAHAWFAWQAPSLGQIAYLR